MRSPGQMRRRLQSWVAVASLCTAGISASGDVVINELMYNPSEPWPNSNRTEYVEILNTGTNIVDLATYRFDNGHGWFEVHPVKRYWKAP